jgi:hypothetical protein
VTSFWVGFGEVWKCRYVGGMCKDKQKYVKSIEKKETTSLWLREHIRCTAGGCRDECDIESK